MTTILKPSSTIDVVDTATGIAISSGDLILDALGVPYGQATIDVPLTAATHLDDYDPRTDRRIIVHGDDGIGSSRTFNLGLRSRTVDYRGKLVTLALATDEALLTDYATLTKDTSAFGIQSSLRTIVNDVLGSAVTLRRNRVPNPGFAVNTAGWAASTGAGSLTQVTTVNGASRFAGQWTATAAGASQLRLNNIPVVPGEVLAFRAEMTAGQAGSFTGQVYVTFFDATGTAGNSDGTQVGPAIYGATAAVSNTAWTIMRLGSVTVPPGAVWARMYPRITNAVVGNTFFADSSHIDNGSTTGSYFDGSTASATGTQYFWDGVASNSTSREAAALNPTPSVDADATTYSDQTNYVANPAAIVDVTGWTGSVGGLLTRQTALTQAANTAKTGLRCSGSASSNATFFEYVITSVPGGPMRFRARQVNGGSAITGTQNADALRIAVGVTTNGGASWTYYKSPVGPTAANAVQDHSVYVDVPPQATQVRIRVYHGVTTTNVVYWTDVMATADAGDPTDIAYWDGSTPDTAAYNYEWQGTVGASTSSRAALIDRTPDSLIWEPGVSAWDFLSPLLTQAGYRLFADEQRIWRMIDPSTYQVPGVVTVSPENATEGSDTISREDADVFATGVVVRYAWTDATGEARTAYDAAGSPAKVFVQDLARSYPGPGAAANILRRRSGTGRTQDVVAIENWAATPGMQASLTLPDSNIQGGKVNSIEWNFSEPTMRVGTAGLIDIPAGSWASTPSTEKWTDPPALTWAQWT